ncbi:MAG: hypothetical protein K8T91_12940 [Planctomycetes bacterium]|nr:hypothetical protein [Planctomycetota bacterium]
MKFLEKCGHFARSAVSACRRHATMAICAVTLAVGSVGVMTQSAMATDPPPLELDELGGSIDVGGIAVAMGTKLGASWSDILLVIAAIAVVGILVAYLFGSFRKTAR